MLSGLGIGGSGFGTCEFSAYEAGWHGPFREIAILMEARRRGNGPGHPFFAGNVKKLKHRVKRA